VIRSFASDETSFYTTGKSRRRPQRFERGRRCSCATNAATRVDDLRLPPSNHLEALKGVRKGQWSIRINDQWRVCFRFEKGDAFDVEIVDYH
jgi:proteic killer suppression protein